LIVERVPFPAGIGGLQNREFFFRQKMFSHGSAEVFDWKMVALSIGLRTDRNIGQILTSENPRVGANKSHSCPSWKAHQNFSYPAISGPADCPLGACREPFSHGGIP